MEVEHDITYDFPRLLDEMRKRNLFCDAYLVGEDKVLVPIHKLILTSRIYMFLLDKTGNVEAFDSFTNESFSNNSPLPVLYIKGYTRELLDAFTSIMYFGNLEEMPLQIKASFYHFLQQISEHLNIDATFIKKSEENPLRKIGILVTDSENQNDRKLDKEAIVTKRPKRTCSFCKKTFETKSLRNHKKACAKRQNAKKGPPLNPNQSVCSDSGERNELKATSDVEKISEIFSSRKGLKRQLKKHDRKPKTSKEPEASESESNHPCPDCGKVFKNKSNVKRHHSVIHKGIQNFHCTLCNRRFGQKVTLELHLATVHKLESFCVGKKGKHILPQDEIKGDATGLLRTFEDSRGLSEKSKKFDVSKLVVAKDLGENTPHEETLQCVRGGNMESSSSGFDLWTARTTCTICKKQFSRPSNLMKHILIHKSLAENGVALDGENSISNFPGEALPSESQPTSEGKINTRGRGHFVCHGCGKKFLLAEYLKKHMSTVHCSTKKFCAHCPKGFVSDSKLRSHQAVHIIWKCARCGGSFEGKRAYNNHLKNSCISFPIPGDTPYNFMDTLLSDIMIDAQQLVPQDPHLKPC